ncbi:MAG: hypothetical protein HW391_598 [Chloroflexi bacterium]|nr:hypothetical protein [Chloroflexota bacterium]
MRIPLRVRTDPERVDGKDIRDGGDPADVGPEPLNDLPGEGAADRDDCPTRPHEPPVGGDRRGILQPSRRCAVVLGGQERYAHGVGQEGRGEAVG